MSRVLAAERYPAQGDRFASAATWLDGERRDYVNRSEPTDRNDASIGCATLFLNHLHYQLGIAWARVVQAAGDTLARTYFGLVGNQLCTSTWGTDHGEHIICIGPDGHIGELAMSPKTHEWDYNDLIRATHSTVAVVAAGSGLAGFSWPADNSEHAVYIGHDGHLHELCFTRRRGWAHADLTLEAGAPLPALPDAFCAFADLVATAFPSGTPSQLGDDNPFPLAGGPPLARPASLAGLVWEADDSEHVIYLSPDGHVHELCLQRVPQEWTHDDLTVAAGAPPAVAGSGLAAYVWEADDSEHVIYLSPDGHVHELCLQRVPRQWTHDDLTVAAGAPPAVAGSGLAAYVWEADDSEHVIYLSPDGHVHELCLQRVPRQWTHDDLTVAAGAPPAVAGSGLAAYVWEADDSEHVIYLSPDGHVHELCLQRVPQEWTHDDLTVAAGAPPAVAGSGLAADVWQIDDSELVVFHTGDGHVHELWLQRVPQEWHHNDLTSRAGAPGSNAPSTAERR